MSQDENKISDLIDGGLHEKEQLESQISELKDWKVYQEATTKGKLRTQLRRQSETIQKQRESLNDAREFLRELELNNAMVKSGRLQEIIKHLSE